MGTITKALELLNYFSISTPEIGLAEFVKRSGRDKATVHRHLTELAENGFLEQHPTTRAYRLGPAILRLTSVREATHPMRRVVMPIVEKLSEEVGELMHMSLFERDHLSPVCHADPRRHGIQVHFDEAELLPLHATSSGMAYLAFADGTLVRKVLSRKLKAYTKHTVTEPDQIRRQIENARASGFGLVAQGFDYDVTSQAVPVFGPDGNAIGAIAVAVPNVRFTTEKSLEIRKTLLRAFQQINHSIGGVVPSQYAQLWSDDD